MKEVDYSQNILQTDTYQKSKLSVFLGILGRLFWFL